MRVLQRFRLLASFSSTITTAQDTHYDDAKMRRVEAVKPRVSFADLQRMPDDGNRYELYDGELVVVPSPLLRHQIVAGRLYEAFV